MTGALMERGKWRHTDMQREKMVRRDTEKMDIYEPQGERSGTDSPCHPSEGPTVLPAGSWTSGPHSYETAHFRC